MKIAHLIFTLKTGGAEIMLIDLINEQIKTTRVSLLIINNQFDSKVIQKIDNRVKVVFIGRTEGNRSPLPIIKLNFYLVLLNPNIVHCHDHNIIRMILRFKNIMLTVHDVKLPTYNYKNYKKIFAVSNAVKTDVKKNSSSINPILIYNGIKLNTIKTRKNYKFVNFKIVQVSRLDHGKKGQHILIMAIKILINQMNLKDINVDFIGDGTSLKYLKGLVNKYQLNKNVNFLGSRDRGFIYDNLHKYNLLVQPSIFEGFGLTVAEAMAAKIPVLVSNVDGPAEIVENRKYGWTFESNDPEACANEIYKIYNSYSKVAKICEKAHIKVNTLFNIKVTSNRYLENYIN